MFAPEIPIQYVNDSCPLRRNVEVWRGHIYIEGKYWCRARQFFADAEMIFVGIALQILGYYLWVLQPSWKPVPWPGFPIVSLIFMPYLTLCQEAAIAIGM